ncbi:fibronectin type III domain-containing protein [Catenuloplanes sp. NPDC051500]|uniref:fibronectin type III domain-containing protein n=1 Tax=Catenuloplanes sp. NPDC051500 TaxID=3363959 RepID=UPI00378A2575
MHLRSLRASLAVLLVLIGAIVIAARPAPALGDVQPAAGQYTPLTPARIATSATVPVQGVFSFDPRGAAGVPATGVSAVAINLTATSTATGYLTVYPAATTRPGTSTVNFRPNLTIANSAVVSLGTGGRVSVYNSSADATVRLHVDITGFFSAAGVTAAGSSYVPLTPARIAAGLPVAAGEYTTVAPLGLGGIPSTGVTAVLAHVTVSSSAVGWISVYPDGVTRPGTSVVNHRDDGGSYTNQVPVTLGANGRFRIYSQSASTVTVDVVGYYLGPAATEAGSSYLGLTPARVLTSELLEAGQTGTYLLAGVGGIPASGASAAAFNLTAAGGTANGALAVRAADAPQTVARLLSYRSGGGWPTMQVSKLSPDGRIAVYNSGGAAVRFHLDVAGYYRAATAPGAPRAVTARAEDGRASLTWTPPATDGGAAITGYRITASPGGGTLDVTGTTSAVFAGLTNGTAYTFTVSAVNVVGRGPSSAASAAVSPAAPSVPGAPGAVTATARDGAVWVAWQRPANDGRLPLDTYTVTASPGGATVTVTATATEVEVPKLTNGTAYTFTVRAANARGAGPASAASATVTPGRTVPDAPVGVLAAAEGNGVVMVEWTAPAYTGGTPITGYTITVQPGGRTVTAPATARSAGVTGLTAGTQYTFAVTARNAVGAGAGTVSEPSRADLTLASKARQLSAAALGTLTGITDTTLAFTGAPAEVTGLPVGTVLVVPDAPVAPDGFLRTVSRVATSGTTTTVSTTDAATSEAFTDGGFGFSGLLPPVSQAGDGFGTQTITPEHEFLVQEWEVAAGVKLNAKIKLSVALDGSIDFPDDVMLSADATSHVEASLTAEQPAELKERELKLGSSDFKAAKASKFFRPNFTVNFSLFVSGSVGPGFTTSLSSAKTAGATVHLPVVTSSSFRNPPAVFEVEAPNTYIDGGVKIGVRVQVVGEMYSKDIAKLNVDAYNDSSVSLLGDPWWKVEDCVRVGAELVPFFNRTAYKNPALFAPNCTRVAGADGALAKLDISPKDVTLARGGTVDLKADSNYLGGTVAWEVQGTDNGTITSAGRYTAPARDGIFTIVATVPAGITRPAQSASVRVSVGLPGLPTVFAFPDPVRPNGVTVPVVGLVVGSGPGAAPESFIVTKQPVESSPIFCDYYILPGPGTYTLLDQNSAGQPCNQFQPGKTYTLTVTAHNANGGSAAARSNPVTVLVPAARSSTANGPSTVTTFASD